MNGSPRPDATSSAVHSRVAGRVSQRTRGLTHSDPSDTSLHDALNAIADPVRRMIIREVAGSPAWSRACGTFDLGVSKATRSHHFTVLRQVGLLEQRDIGARRFNNLRVTEFEAAFPGLLALVLTEETTPSTVPAVVSAARSAPGPEDADRVSDDPGSHPE